MDLGRPASLLPESAAEQNLQRMRGGVAGSRLIESHMEEISEDGHEAQSIMPEKLPLGGSEDLGDGAKPYASLESFYPLGHGGRGDHIVIVSHWRESGLDIEGRPLRRKIRERIAPAMISAKEEKDKYAIRVMRTRYALNAAIGLQVLTGALTTAISAATSGKQTSIAVSALGGLTTLVASYLAFARGSGEPELSNARIKDLEHFLRDCEMFTFDHGEEYGTSGNQLDEQIESLRRRFELLLGNNDA
ncbi:hypothetical protein K503DRAFT_705760 [Rhizopogon vinicolor AM-OR11-026]|uniref:SMODS and SLOG-associating 2TM effector domain-containing protein n=1 Tax=Rhizopogon vinicolor AM-OR11-026 TaxID=1314800 RepID=A0A1B7NIP8_9AGAM|nr:hypothetical protein K503DRAFT_705760 [Rhizopogon vinicolor AM-OR11-026]